MSWYLTAGNNLEYIHKPLLHYSNIEVEEEVVVVGGAPLVGESVVVIMVDGGGVVTTLTEIEFEAWACYSIWMTWISRLFTLWLGL